jgi:hypothetical protein
MKHPLKIPTKPTAQLKIMNRHIQKGHVSVSVGPDPHGLALLLLVSDLDVVVGHRHGKSMDCMRE